MSNKKNTPAKDQEVKDPETVTAPVVETAANPAEGTAENTAKTPEVKKAEKPAAKTEKAKPAKPAKKKVQILSSNCAGLYLLSCNKGDVVTLPTPQADEMIEAGHAKDV